MNGPEKTMPDGFDALLRCRLRVAARRCKRRGLLCEGEMEDFVQGARLAVVRAMGAYCAERGSQGAFVGRVIENAQWMFLRSRRWKYREICMGRADQWGIFRSLSPPEILMRRELPEWVYALSPCHQQVCRWILQRVSRRVMARRLGMSVDTFYRTVWRELRVSALRAMSNEELAISN